MSSDCQSLRSSSAGTHEPICTQATRPCWAEFAASLVSLLLGIVCVMVGAANDNSALSSTVGRSGNGASVGAKAATYAGVALLIAGAVLMVVFGVHFRLVKQRLDRDRLMRCARLGIRPTSKYSAVPELPEEPAIVASPSTTGTSATVLSTGAGFYSNVGFANSRNDCTYDDARPPADTGASFSSASTSGIGSCSPASSNSGASFAQLSVHRLQQQQQRQQYQQQQQHPQQQQLPPPPPQRDSMFAPYGYRSSQI